MYQCPRCRYEFERPMWSTYNGDLYKAFCPACGYKISRGCLGTALKWLLILTVAQIVLSSIGALLLGSGRNQQPTAPAAVVAVEVANLRVAPARDATVITRLQRGDTVRVLQPDSAGWTQVRTGRHRGFVSSGLVKKL
jgi:hypothetical protein